MPTVNTSSVNQIFTSAADVIESEDKELYQRIADSIKLGETRGNKVSRGSILHVLFIGGPRNMISVCMSHEDEPIDEIRQFQDARWLLAKEAMWRIFKFEFNEINPQFLMTCSLDEEARGLLYRKFLEYYIWDKQTKLWSKWKSRQVIDRVNDLRGERYYFRLFLRHIRGPKSFDDLLTVNNVQYLTFKEEITDEMVVEILEEVINAIQKLNIKQLHAYRIFLRRVDLNSSGVFFMDGLGGTGKTFLYHVLLVYVRSMGMIALAGATSGVAASIILGGRTTHSRFSILLSPTESSMYVQMEKRLAIETVDRSLRYIMNNSQPFGGKIMLFGEDFRQVLLVVSTALRQENVSAKFILRVGNGEELEIKEGNIRIPEEMVAKYENENSCEEALIDAVYPSLEENARLAQYMTNRAILATKNEYVNSFNEKMINIFPSESNIYTSFDEAVDDANNYYQEKFLNTLLPNELSPHKLEFKMNCPIILLRNLDPSNGLCNGTIIVHISFKKNVIYAEIISRKHGKQVLLPRISLSPTENERYPFYFKIKQFLGQTISNINMYLPHDVFSHGQLYVMLSRGVSMSTTKSDNKRKKK
ncbi:hypothetical protein MANES_13G095601v8 [Manihot esculenta]|uniref:Uncharacterized protein n=1 Tax=Manihot esculenta TaxID=3983 RepID=A0ACB7GL27_MANES|nr:hypothetical protein MANES_13G095601v8 [Manihot esculenta]